MVVNEDLIKNIGIIIPNNSTLPGKEDDLLENLQNIPNEDLKKMGDGFYLNLIIKDLNKGIYDNLDKDAALTLINNNHHSLFFTHFNYFKGLDKEVAMALIGNGLISGFVSKIKFFVGLDKEVAMTLINNGYDIDLRDFIENDRKEIAIYAIGKGKSVNLFHIMNISNDDDLEFAKQLISLNEIGCRQVVSVLNQSLNPINKNYKKAIALHMINDNYSDILLDNVESFEGGLDKEVAMALIDNDYIDHFIIKINYFVGLDKEVAMALINHNYATILYDNIGCFEGLDEEVYTELGKRGFEIKMDNLSESSRKIVAIAKVGKGESIDIFKILDKIDTDDDLEFAKQLIGLNEIGCNLVIELVKNTTNKTYLNAIALEMINNNYISQVLDNIDSFDKGLGSDVALAFINYDITQFIAYIGYFEGLNGKVVKALDDAGFHDIIDRYPECF